MNIEGTYTFQAKSEAIRERLADSETLRRIIPGLEHLEQVGEKRYDVAIHIRYAPLAGNYRGYITISRSDDDYRFVIESNGDADTISGSGSIQFRANGDNTTLIYRGTLAISRHGTQLSPVVTRGAAKFLMQQFFSALANQLHANMPSEEEAMGKNGQSGRQDIFISLPEGATPTPIAQGIVHRLGLGADDPLQERIWANRVRRIGLISGFLLLVWIGTRLPPRER
jgi:carbon monoxide dehydrogenase subunit G